MRITREQAEAYAKCGDCNTCAVKRDCAARLGTADRRYFGTEILALMDEGPGVWRDAPENAEKADIYWRDVDGDLFRVKVYFRTPPKTSERIAAEERAARMVGKTAEEIADILMEDRE